MYKATTIIFNCTIKNSIAKIKKVIYNIGQRRLTIKSQ